MQLQINIDCDIAISHFWCDTQYISLCVFRYRYVGLLDIRLCKHTMVEARCTIIHSVQSELSYPSACAISTCRPVRLINPVTLPNESEIEHVG